MMIENGYLERGESHLSQVVNPVLFVENNIKLVERYPDIGITRYPESYFLKK